MERRRDNAWTSLGPEEGLTSLAIHPADPNVMYATRMPPLVGGAGTSQVLRTGDGGTSWDTVFDQALFTDSSTTMRGYESFEVVIDAANPSRVYALRASASFSTSSSSFVALRSTDGGGTWAAGGTIALSSPGSAVGLWVDAFNTGTLYVSANSRIYKSTDAGQVWAVVSFRAFTAIAVDPRNGNLLAGTGSGVSRSTDGGSTWSDIELGPTTLSFAFEPATGTFYIGTANGIYKSLDGGITWDAPGSRYLGPHYTASANVVAAQIAVGAGSPAALIIGHGCGYYLSLDGGATFSQANAGIRVLNPGTNCYWSTGRLLNSALAPMDFVLSGAVLETSGANQAVVSRYTLVPGSLPPVCSLTANPVSVGEGESSTLSTYCSPAATSYGWSANAGLASPAAGGTVSPSRTTTYSVQGINGNGASPTQSVTVWAPSPRAANLSTRGIVLGGENVLIGGAIVGGIAPKTILIRARGPSLASSGVTGFLANPTLEVGGFVNDDWQSAPNAAAIQASGFAPAHPAESAVMMTVQPGSAHTAIVRGAGGSTGIAIVEVFEVDHPEVPLIDIATRGLVQTGDNVLIGGFVVQGHGPLRVVVRARGPSLGPAGLANPLADPAIQVFSSQTSIATNDDWTTSPDALEIQSLGFAPAHAKEAAVLLTLQPGAYTAVVTGANGTTGVGIVEVFAVP